MADYSFKPGWKASLLLVVAVLLFVSLGFWQLRRAAEKESLQAIRDQRGTEPPARLLDLLPADLAMLRFRPVVVTGEYDAGHQFLVDNQVQGQRSGYHVLTPLRFDGGEVAVLVNRGWVPLGATRADLPDVSLERMRVELTGIVDQFPKVGMKLAGAEVPGTGWPSVVAVPETERLGERLGYPVLPYQILLDPHESEGYVRAWQATRLDPGKNRGYALQWFLFAGVATLLYLRHGLGGRSR